MDMPAKLDKIMRQAKKYTIEGDVRNPRVTVGSTPPGHDDGDEENEVPEPTTPTEPEPNISPENSQNRQNNEPKQESVRTSVSRKEEQTQMKNTLLTKNRTELTKSLAVLEELQDSEPLLDDPMAGAPIDALVGPAPGEKAGEAGPQREGQRRAWVSQSPSGRFGSEVSWRLIV